MIYINTYFNFDNFIIILLLNTIQYVKDIRKIFFKEKNFGRLKYTRMIKFYFMKF